MEGKGQGVNPSRARFLSAPYPLLLEMGRVRLCQARPPGLRTAKQPLLGPSLSQALPGLPVSHMYHVPVCPPSLLVSLGF